MAVDVLVATGHRAPKLGGYEHAVEAAVDRLALKVIEQHEPFTVVSGMALTWDQAIARAAVKLKIPFIAVIPFDGYDSKWPAKTQQEYRRLLEQAQAVEVFSNQHGMRMEKNAAVAALKKRNEALLTYCDGVPDHVVAALWNGKPEGGTYYTVREAEKRGLRIVNYYASWVKYGPGISEEEGKRRAQERRTARLAGVDYRTKDRLRGRNLGMRGDYRN